MVQYTTCFVAVRLFSPFPIFRRLCYAETWLIVTGVVFHIFGSLSDGVFDLSSKFIYNVPNKTDFRVVLYSNVKLVSAKLCT